MTGVLLSLMPGVAALTGAVLGGLTCTATTHLMERRQFHAERIVRDLDRREEVYSRFIDQASEMWLEAFETPHDPGNLIGLCALVGRIRLVSTQPVLDAAEALLDFLLDTCQRAPMDVRELAVNAPREFMAPLTRFTAACRAERERMLRSL